MVARIRGLVSSFHIGRDSLGARFFMYHLHLDSISWEEQHSPTKKFQSYCRKVSIAVGGLRNTGTWRVGHPFDLQIRRLPPGAAV